MLQSHVIEVGGTFVGAAITTSTGHRFRAVHLKVEELDGSVWRSLAELSRAAAHLFTTGQSSGAGWGEHRHDPAHANEGWRMDEVFARAHALPSRESSP